MKNSFISLFPYKFPSGVRIPYEIFLISPFVGIYAQNFLENFPNDFLEIFVSDTAFMLAVRTSLKINNICLGILF